MSAADDAICVQRSTADLNATYETRSLARRPPFVRLSALALMLVLGLGACGSERGEQGRVATMPTTASDPTTTAKANATVTSTTLVDCPSGMGAAAQGPAEAARCLYEGWSEGNRRKAAVFASLDVVEQLFQDGKGPPEASFEGCRTDGDTGRDICTYEHEGHRYRFEVQRSEGGWRVTGVDS